MRTLTIITLLISVVLISGCGNKTIITGTVKLSDGTPVTQGQIVFDNGTNSYFGAIDGAGHYATGGNKTVEGIPDGKYKVWFSGTEIIENELDADGFTKSYSVTLTMAKKYTSASTTDLEFNVQSGGEKTFDIVVEPPEK